MWCSNCRQDVPGVAAPQNPQVVVCARCGESLDHSTHTLAPSSTTATTKPAEHETSISDTLKHPLLDFDDWELDDDLETTEETLQGFNVGIDAPATSPTPHSTATTAAPSTKPIYQFHPPHAQPLVSNKPKQRRPSLLGWALITFGMVGFSCGAVLTGWSLAAGRTELWSMGIPTLLLGQATLLAGLIFQMEGLWKNDYQTQKSLDALEQRVSHLNHSTKLLTTTQSGPSQAFHMHMAEGAHPQMLLADLKGQLDLLTTQLASEQEQ